MRKFLIFSVLWMLLCPALRADIPACYHDIERNFFRPEWVGQALSFHNVSQSAWREINRKLQHNVTQVPRIVRELASKVQPNPFYYPYDLEMVEVILKQALLEVLTKTLIEFNIRNPNMVSEIFNYIMEQQKAQWEGCFGKEETKKV